MKDINTKIILTEYNAEHKLQCMKLSSEGLTQSCLQGFLSRANCTCYNTKGGPGFIQWDGTVKALREYFCGSNWEKYEYGGLEGIISPDKTIRIIPSSGNAATGNINQPASNRNPKGINMIQLIEKNQQGSLFEGFPVQINDDNFETYVLLFYNDDRELRMELSKPASIIRGRIVAWAERIIIKPYEFENIALNTEEPIDEDFIDIPVIRKQI